MSDTNLQSDIVGKKIFFLYPTGAVQDQIISELVQQEYEVYVSKDAKRLARALKKFPDSVVFVNIDDGMSEQEWEKWIHTLMTALPELKIGIFTSSSDEEVRRKYIEDIKVSCGFMSLKLDMSRSIGKILEVLNALNVKGRRKYIRASTDHEANATLNIPHGGEFVNGVVKDISVVGISCVFEMDPDLTKNSLIKDIQLRLQTMLLKVEAIAFGSRSDRGDKIYVLLFTQRIDPDIKVKIRKYIQQSLQGKMETEMNKG